MLAGAWMEVGRVWGLLPEVGNGAAAQLDPLLRARTGIGQSTRLVAAAGRGGVPCHLHMY